MSLLYDSDQDIRLWILLMKLGTYARTAGLQYTARAAILNANFTGTEHLGDGVLSTRRLKMFCADSFAYELA